MTRSIRLGLVAGAALAALPALAQTQTGTPAPQAASPAAAPSNAAEAYEQAMARMHMSMMVEPTGDADVDFARGMIPHHQGAIDMARIQLQFGDNPELRRMAEEIIRAQEAEIATLRDWMQRNAPDAAGDAAGREAPPSNSSANLSANPATETAPEPKPDTGTVPEPKPSPSGAPAPRPAN